MVQKVTHACLSALLLVTTSFVCCGSKVSRSPSGHLGGELAQLQLDLVRNVASANDVNKLKSVLEKALDEIQAARSQEGNLPVGQWKSLKLLRNAPISNVVAVIGGGLSGLTAS